LQKTLDKNVSNLNLDVEQAEEKLLETDLEYLLRNAQQQMDWRLALRIYYLMVLKNLHEFNYIKWRKEKTNFDYNLELQNWQSLPDWKKITLQYERSWYGEQLLPQTQFLEQEANIKLILQNLSTQPTN
jgi:hypothetical protein